MSVTVSMAVVMPMFTRVRTLVVMLVAGRVPAVIVRFHAEHLT